MTANAGYHAYATGDVLTAAQVQYNLQNQTVMYFATTTARDAALTGAILVEGMVSYTPATGVMYYNGTAWTAIGATSPANVPNLSNPILNSAFQVWQRGTSISVAASTQPYTADRWQIQTGASVASTVSRQATADTTNLPNIQYCARVQRNSGQTGTTGIAFAQNFESINSIPFSGKTVTFSFYARAGANYSAASNALAVYVISGTGTDQNVFVGGITGQSNFIASSATLTTTWQRFTFTGTVSTTATQLIADLIYTPVGTAGANDYYEVTGVQLEVGSTATAFNTYATTIQGELAACRRYLPAFNGLTEDYMGYAYGTNTAMYTIPFDVVARTAPTGITASGTFGAFSLNSSTSVTPTFNAAGVNAGTVLASLTIVAGQGSRLSLSTSALILFTGCEL